MSEFYKPPFGSSAAYYVNKGINVFPIIPGTKKPAVKWKHLQSEKMNEKTLGYMIRYYANYNIAIVTGSISGIAVVDVDGEEGTNNLKEYSLPDTLTVKTARGYHLYYSLPEGVALSSAIGLMPKVDVKADGGYVIAPPSVSADRVQYKWNMSPSGLKSLPPLPEWVIQKIGMRQDGIIPTGKAGLEEFESRRNWLKEIVDGVGEGQRNNACSRYAGWLISKGYDEDACIKELLTWNLKNTPPMPEAEVAAVFQSVLVKDRTRSYREATPTTLDDAKERIAQHLFFEDDTIIDVVLATALTYNHECGPLWLIIVGPPSSGKTEILRSLRQYKDTVFIESITGRTLFTGMRNAMGVLERNKQDYLLMINKDFGSIMAKPSTERGVILQQLRGVFDGEYIDETGGGKGTIEWRNRLNFLSASTQDIESVASQAALADLGERFLYYKMKPEGDEIVRKKAMLSISGHKSDKTMRNVVASAMLGVLKTYDGFDASTIKFPDTIAGWLVELCMVAVKLRTRVKRDSYRKGVIEYKPSPEGVMRMLKSAKGLLLGLTIVRGKKESDIKDYALVARVVMDSIPSYRKTILKTQHFSDKWMTPKEMAAITNISAYACELIMDDFHVVGMADKDTNETLPVYKLKSDTMESIKRSGLEGLL